MTTIRTAAHPLRRFDTFEAYLPDDFDAATIVRDHHSWRFDATYKPNPRFEPTLTNPVRRLAGGFCRNPT